jgi:flagellar basal body-associated protein FliL
MPKLNEIRSIDIDFSATMSSRMSRMKLAKMEFELRDHLILNVEPMVASFPLEEEGKEILRKKLTLEINDFMIANKIEGEVQEIKLIYILGN